MIRLGKLTRDHVLFASTAILLAYFLSVRWELALNRYMDIDEFAHLHWSAQILMGARPFADFLTFFPPGFHLLVSPSFLFGWGTTDPVIAARILMFGILLCTAGALGYLFIQLRGRRWTALLPALFLLVVPIPSDKLLEIRPDLPATLAVIIATILQLRWMERRRAADGMLSGIAYAASYLILPKMVPNILIGILVYVMSSYPAKGALRERIRSAYRTLRPVIVGMIAPIILFFLYAFLVSDMHTALYSLFRLPVEANRISRYFIMMPMLFFYPNAVFYGVDGWSRGLLFNHSLWMLGLLWGTYRLVAPGIAGGKKWKGELLVALHLAVQLLFYVKLAPLKHAQYLIPIAAFFSLYLADLTDTIWMRTRGNRLAGSAVAIVLIGLGAFFFSVFNEVNEPKREWTNTEMLSDIRRAMSLVPADEKVLDLDGWMFYHKDAYYACCIPFGQFGEFLTRPLPSLSETLERDRINYIAEGNLKRVRTLPWQDQVYIDDRFQPMPGAEGMLLVRKGF